MRLKFFFACYIGAFCAKFASLENIRCENKYYDLKCANKTFEELDTIENLNSITTYLGFENCTIKTLTFALFESATTVTALNVNGNQVEIIKTDTFSNMKKLHSLVIKSNKISSIESKTFEGLDNLVLLDASHNLLTSLNDEIFTNLEKLEFLDLSYNSLKTIGPKIFCKLSELKHLHLNDNTLKEIDKTAFWNVTNLLKLILNDNSLNNITSELFKNLNKLKLLDISNNNFSDFETGAFNGLNKLQVLKLSGNRLKSLSEHTVKPLKSLQILNASNNSLKTFNATKSLSKIPDLKVISLNANFLTCQLLSNMKTAFKTRNVEVDYVDCLPQNRIYEEESNKNMNILANTITNEIDNKFTDLLAKLAKINDNAEKRLEKNQNQQIQLNTNSSFSELNKKIAEIESFIKNNYDIKLDNVSGSLAHLQNATKENQEERIQLLNNISNNSNNLNEKLTKLEQIMAESLTKIQRGQVELLTNIAKRSSDDFETKLNNTLIKFDKLTVENQKKQTQLLMNILNNSSNDLKEKLAKLENVTSQVTTSQAQKLELLKTISDSSSTVLNEKLGQLQNETIERLTKNQKNQTKLLSDLTESRFNDFDRKLANINDTFIKLENIAVQSLTEKQNLIKNIIDLNDTLNERNGKLTNLTTYQQQLGQTLLKIISNSARINDKLRDDVKEYFHNFTEINKGRTSFDQVAMENLNKSGQHQEELLMQISNNINESLKDDLGKLMNDFTKESNKRFNFEEVLMARLEESSNQQEKLMGEISYNIFENKKLNKQLKKELEDVVNDTKVNGRRFQNLLSQLISDSIEQKEQFIQLIGGNSTGEETKKNNYN